MSVRLRTMTVDDLPAVLALEEELFAPDTWTVAMYRDELSRTDTRRYLVAEEDGDLVAYNAYLARLAKEVRGHGRWHGLR